MLTKTARANLDKQLCDALASENREAALLLARDVVDRFPDDARLLLLAFRAARKIDRPLAILLAERLIAIGHDRPLFLVQLGKLKLGTGDAAGGLAALRAAVAEGADEDALLPLLARAVVAMEDWGEARRLWLAMLDPGRALSVEQRDTARIALRRLDRDRKTDRINRDIPAMPAAHFFAPLHPRAEGPRLFRSAAQDLLCHRVPGSREALLVFGGLSVMMGMARPVMTDAHRDCGANVLMFGDPAKALMMEGAVSLGGDYAATLAALRGMLAAWAIDRLYVAGSSAGAFAALRYGFDLGAHRIALISPGLRLLDGPENATAIRLRALLGPLATDLRSFLAAADAPSEVLLAYDPAEAQDIAWADHLRAHSRTRFLPCAGLKTAGEARFVYDLLLADSAVAPGSRARIAAA